ncbi:MAG: MBL fold metallo-hydrolase [Clostridiales bacterium]|jgi:L-ascorbate metabolism protein UlaG (beta-lactamase superfamily)|nr:MBL fold metallo-hydrolase [Clostridiales bacterium]
MPKLLYQGHGSYRLTSDNGRVIYVDPYAGEGYGAPADIILVTHQHGDHNQIQLCAKKPNCRIISNEEALMGGKRNSFEIDGIQIQAVEAKNLNHNPKHCVGYIVTLDGVKIYASGDTSKTEQMETFAGIAIDYALFPGDGIFNMGVEEAAECARIVGAKHNIIIHLKPGSLFDSKKAERWDAPNKLIVEPGREIDLDRQGR